MATNDLMMELQKDSIKLDEDSERKVVAMLLKLLEDKNGEVQNLAVKWWEPGLVSCLVYQAVNWIMASTKHAYSQVNKSALTSYFVFFSENLIARSLMLKILL